jgi:hypothetical protein
MDHAADARPLDPSIASAALSDLSSKNLPASAGLFLRFLRRRFYLSEERRFQKRSRLNAQGRRNQSKGIVTERTATSDATRTDVSIMNTTICLVDISGKSDFMILPQLKYYSIIGYSIIKLHE